MNNQSDTKIMKNMLLKQNQIMRETSSRRNSDTKNVLGRSY